MKKKIIFSGMLFLIGNIVNAQYTPAVFPPSPNATSIAKFVESPVSHYNGTVNISIPLFTIENTDFLAMDLSIRYDPKGIRVGEMASSIGAGWSLNTGGLITRQVRQRPDEYTKGYLTYSYNANFENNAVIREQLQNENAAFGDSDTPVDEDPDLFFISFLGRSAKFIIDNTTKKAVTQGFNDWKIDIDYEDYTSGNFRINRIIITDESGVQYYFGKDSSGLSSAYDIVNSVSSGLITESPANQENGYKTAWHLKEIKTKKNTYLFDYTPEQVVTYSKTDIRKGDNVGAISLTNTSITQQVIRSISFPEGVLKFEYSVANREDLSGGKALQNILLKDNQGLQIKKVSFLQNYRLGDGNHNNIHPVVLSKDSKSDRRLFLNQLNETGRDQNIISSYKFEYNPRELPNRHSNSIDYWGFFNGRQNNTNIFIDAEEANRDVYGSYAEAGILTKITYPTGGSENFYYEDNNVLIPNYFSNFILANPSRLIYDEKSTAITKAQNNFVLNNGSIFFGKYIKEFEIPEIYGNKFSYTALLGNGCTSVETTNCKTKVRLHRYDQDTGAILASYVVTQGNNKEVINPPLESGNYRLEVSNPNFTLSDSENYETNPFSVTLHWKEYKPNIPFNSFIGGGRRISKIEVNENGKITKRKFTYTYDDGNTSGKLLGIPDYMCIIKKYGNISLVAGQLSNRIQPMSSFNNAGQVGYSQVKESLLSADNSVLWSKKYNFSNYSDGGEYYRFPYHLPDDMSWARGLNLKTESYNSSAQLIEAIENKYHFSGEEFSPYKIYKRYDGTMLTNTPYNELSPDPTSLSPSSLHYMLSHNMKSIPIYKFGDYTVGPTSQSNQSPNIYRTSFFHGGMIKNYMKIKTEYINGVASKITYINTTQESPYHHQLSKQETLFPDGVLQQTTYAYAHEKGNQLLIGKNMIGIPLETTTVQKQGAADPGKTVAKAELIYPASLPTAQAGSLVVPLSSKSMDKLTGILSTDVSYDKYDEKGNILQYTGKDGLVTSIVWGYNKTRPIAKIEGITYDHLLSLASPAAIISASDEDAADPSRETQLLEALNTFRKNSQLADKKVTTYTYDPLIGVTSITPPSGIRQSFSYDAANRLKETKVRGKNPAGTYTDQKAAEYRYNYKP